MKPQSWTNLSITHPFITIPKQPLIAFSHNILIFILTFIYICSYNTHFTCFFTQIIILRFLLHEFLSNIPLCSLVQSLSHVLLIATPWTAARQASLPITNSWSLLKFMSIELVMPSNHLILCHSLLLPSVFPSIRVFSNESILCIKWPKYWSFSFSISPSNEYLGLISFRIDWFDLLAVQGTLKSLLLHHSSKSSILWCSAVFRV